MATPYIAHVVDGIVESVQRAEQDYVDANPDLYTGVWVRVESMDNYPAPGWSWSAEAGFAPPVDEADNG